MGYYTYFYGEAEITLETHYVNFLTEVFERYLPNGGSEITETKFKVLSSWKNYSEFMEDVLFFIQKNGKIHSCKIVADGEEFEDLSVIRLEEGKLKRFYYAFNEEKRIEISWDKFLEYLLEYETPTEVEFQEENEKEEMWEEWLNDGKTENYPEMIEEMKKQGSEFKIIFGRENIVFENKKLYSIPFVPEENGEELTLRNYQIFQNQSMIKLSSYVFNLSKTITYKNKTFLYHPWFMEEWYDEDNLEKIITNEKGETYSPCDRCKKRLEKITGSCLKCKPDYENL